MEVIQERSIIYRIMAAIIREAFVKIQAPPEQTVIHFGESGRTWEIRSRELTGRDRDLVLREFNTAKDREF